MPFILKYNAAGLACPHIQCDKCSRVIDDASGAMLLWDPDSRQNRVVVPVIVCSACDDVRDSALPYSMGLGTALILLLKNCGLVGERLEEARQTAKLNASIT